MAKPLILDVGDTALWVATYRAQESERADALFRDPLARRLAGERGGRIASGMSKSRYTRWSVVIRTHIIDTLIREQVAAGVDMVINLGAGLDTRPYRLELPASLRWIEVDYPRMVELKERGLAGETPRCELERVSADLADPQVRAALFSRLGSECKKALVLTEGLIFYLSNEDVSALARDLSLQPSFRFWVAEYHSPVVMKYMKTKKRQRQMKNAPFRFEPSDWFAFFEERGWKARDIRYLSEESEKAGRAIPMPWWVEVLRFVLRPKRMEAGRKFSAYVLLEPKPPEFGIDA